MYLLLIVRTSAQGKGRIGDTNYFELLLILKRSTFNHRRKWNRAFQPLICPM